MLIPLWFAIFYPIAIIAFVITVYLAGKDFPKKPYFRATVSSLGQEGRLGHRVFNPMISFIGIMNFILIYTLSLSLPRNILTFIGFGLLFIGSAASILMGVFHTGHKSHTPIAFVMSFGYFLGILFLIYPFVTSNLIPKWVVFFSILNLIGSLFLLKTLKYRTSFWYNLQKPITKNFPFWEWMLLISILLWMIIIFIVLFLA